MGNRNDGLNTPLFFIDEMHNWHQADTWPSFFKSHPPKIKEIRFSGPATIVFFEDNTKQVVKYSEEEEFEQDKCIGVLWALAEKCSVGPYKKFKSKNQLVKFASEYVPWNPQCDPVYGLWHIVYDEFVEKGPYNNASELNDEINKWIAKDDSRENAWAEFVKELYNWMKEN